MRSFSARSRTSSTIRPIVEAASIVSTSAVPRAARAVPALAITSSPTRVMSSSSLSARTRTKLLSISLVFLIRSCFSSAASTSSFCTAPWPDQDLADLGARPGFAARLLQVLLQAQAFLELSAGERAALHEQLAQPRLVLGQGVDQVDCSRRSCCAGEECGSRNPRAGTRTRRRWFPSPPRR